MILFHFVGGWDHLIFYHVESCISIFGQRNLIIFVPILQSNAIASDHCVDYSCSGSSMLVWRKIHKSLDGQAEAS